MAILKRTPDTERSKQEERVRDVFRRRLAMPLLDMEVAHARFLVWEGSHPLDEAATAGQKKPASYKQEVYCQLLRTCSDHE